jgi:hypothetical protein
VWKFVKAAGSMRLTLVTDEDFKVNVEIMRVKRIIVVTIIPCRGDVAPASLYVLSDVQGCHNGDDVELCLDSEIQKLALVPK